MEKEMFYREMKNKGEEIGIDFSVEQLWKTYRYMELLIDWNQKINLTAITEPKEIIQKHFIDSLTINKNIKNAKKVVDIGTGAGFPGVPLGIMNEKTEMFLVDSLNKRIIFLEEVVKELNLKNITLIHARAEDFGKKEEYREKFDIAVSRAVANLSTLSEYLVPLVKIGGKVISMKASDASEEINNAKKAINVLGGAIENVEKFTLPESDIGRTIVTIRKERSTPSRYPRKAGLPSKEPIK